VMRDAICPDFLTRPIKRLLAFSHSKDFCIQRLVGTFSPHSLKQPASIWNQWAAAQFPILRACRGVAAHNDLASVKIDIAPLKRIGLALSHSRNGQAQREVSAVDRIAPMSISHFDNQRVEFVCAWKHDFFGTYRYALQSRCRIDINHAS